MYFFYMLVIAVAIEIIRLSFKAKSNNNDKKLGWLVNIGFLLAMAFIIYQILIVAIGDAAGHGMKAGTMVAAIKGLFTAENHNMDLVNF